jgi:glyoxylase-like metal-dependent hydrolase (beta-lactamase superfamily II)
MVDVTQLFAGVWLLHGEVSGRPLHLPVLAGPWQTLLLDTGCASHVDKLIRPGLRRAGVEVTHLSCVINTHCDVDHQGGNHEMKRLAPRAVLCCGDADREQIESPEAIFRLRYDAYRAHEVFYDGTVKQWMLGELGHPQPVDLTFRGGERLRLGPDWEVEIVHLPGHSHGHLGVLDLKHRMLFGGDAIHGAVYRHLQGQAALCPTYLHVAAYRQTIQFIEKLDPTLYVGCHWPVKRGKEVGEFCAESRGFVDRAERLLIGALREARTLRQLCQELGPALGDWPPAVNQELCYAFGGHLHDLEARGVIGSIPGTKPPQYRLR